MIRLRIRTLIIAIITTLGVWQVGEGAYIHAKAQLAQQLIEDAWQQTLESLENTKPWPWADTWPVGRIQVPKYNIDLYILAGDHGQSLAFGPGHNSSTTLPGNIGSSIISGHRDTHFAFLEHINSGDEILLQDKTGRWHPFIVNGQRVLDARAGIQINNNNERLYLVTCYPFNAILPNGPLRYVVSAESAKSVKL